MPLARCFLCFKCTKGSLNKRLDDIRANTYNPPWSPLRPQAMLRGSLRKTFGGFDVLCLGLGILIGSGWAQFTGTAGVYAG
jgi:hypothetical protein